jgi:hypothetical protein
VAVSVAVQPGGSGWDMASEVADDGFALGGAVQLGQSVRALGRGKKAAWWMSSS